MSKRAMETNVVVDENERSLYAIFRSTANLLSQFYSQSILNQKLAFEAGESHALLEIHKWMMGKLQEGRMITAADILGYLQEKMDSLSPGDGQAANGSAGMATSSLALLEQGSYPGTGMPSSVGLAASPGMASVQMTDCSFGPQDQNSAEMAANLFAPEDLNGYLEMTEHDSYPDAQMGGM